MKIRKRILTPVEDYSWDGNTKEAIVLHITAGSNYKGAEDTLKIRHLSYHFIIDKDGSISQLTDINRSAWHAGIKSNPVDRVVKFFGDTNPNKRSIGISFVCEKDEWYVSNELTEKQIDAGVWLIKYIGSQTGIRYNGDNIFTHGEITDYKEKMEEERKIIVSELIGYRDEQDVVKLSSVVERLKIKLQTLKDAKKGYKATLGG